METIVYQKNVSRAQLIMDEPPGSSGSWELDMLLFNEPENLLPVSECCEGEVRRCYYDVTGASALSAVMIRSSFDSAMIRGLMTDLCAALDQTADYLLDGGKLLLDPGYIYYRKEHYRFCYRPFAAADFDGEFEELAAFVSEHVDSGDDEAAGLAGRLYRLALDKSADLASVREVLENLPPELPEDEETGCSDGGGYAEDDLSGFALSEHTLSEYTGEWTEEELSDIDRLFCAGPRDFTIVPPHEEKRKKKRPQRKAASVWGDWTQFNLDNP